MTSQALDLTTMGHALNELCDAFLGECEWSGINDEQQEFLAWYAAHREEIRKLSDLEALASTDFAALNAFLQARSFSPMFEPFIGIGVASVLDMLVEWAIKGESTTITRNYNWGSDSGDVYPAFKIPADGVDIYDVPGCGSPLVRLHTKTGHHLWLMKCAEPTSGLELNRLALKLLTRMDRRPQFGRFTGAIVPMLEMDLAPDLSWMLGTTAIGTQGKYAIQRVFQKFKLRANDKGARVKVVTGMVMMTANAMAPSPQPYLLDDPFIGFFTQPDNETLPLAVFWADTDVWQNPGGTLEEL